MNNRERELEAELAETKACLADRDAKLEQLEAVVWEFARVNNGLPGRPKLVVDQEAYKAGAYAGRNQIIDIIEFAYDPMMRCVNTMEAIIGYIKGMVGIAGDNLDDKKLPRVIVNEAAIDLGKCLNLVDAFERRFCAEVDGLEQVIDKSYAHRLRDTALNYATSKKNSDHVLVEVCREKQINSDHANLIQAMRQRKLRVKSNTDVRIYEKTQALLSANPEMSIRDALKEVIKNPGLEYALTTAEQYFYRGKEYRESSSNI